MREPLSLRKLGTAITLSVGLLCSVGLGTAWAGNSKVTICHVPPDNPDRAHEIVVSETALGAHLANHPGDRVGPCERPCTSMGDCDDANACTIDICTPDGSCDNSEAVDCSDGDVCTFDSCEPATGCVNPPVPTSQQVPCDDADRCSEGDLCVAGVCTGSPIPGCCTADSDCPASDACAVRYCDDATGTCREIDISSQCTAIACEVAYCDPLTGCGVAAAACADDGDLCTIEVCNPLICGDSGGCESIPNPSPPEPGLEVTCDDGLDNDCDGLVDASDQDCSTSGGCTSDADCPLCQQCNDPFCVNQAPGVDFKNECEAFACDSFVWGSDGAGGCAAAEATVLNGSCDGTGACASLSKSCSGAGVLLAQCGSAACFRACPQGAPASAYDTPDEVCFTDFLQHDCPSGSVCDAFGSCVPAP